MRRSRQVAWAATEGTERNSMTIRTMTINGRGTTGPTFDVINPATEEVVFAAPDCSRDQLDTAMRAAADAYVGWRRDEDLRRDVLRRCADVIEENADLLGRLHTVEQGRPIEPATANVHGQAARFRRYADMELATGPRREDSHTEVRVRRRPLGVIAAVKPWNGLTFDVIPAALIAGNTVVYKPSPHTPMTALALGELLRDIVPPGVLNVVTGLDPLGAWMVNHPVPAGVSFTGSIPTGRAVYAAAAPTLKRVNLELGGNDPAIVLDDADVAEIVPDLFWAAFRNSGQICMAVKRLYVPARMSDALTDALADYASQVVVGDGLDPRTQLGPVTNEAQYSRVRKLIDGAAGQGARVASDGSTLPERGYFIAPTLVAGAAEGMPIVDEEQFGPVLPVIAYDDLEDAIARANATEFGLGASVWTADRDRGEQVIDRLDAGNAWVNTHLRNSFDAPFAASKQSGVGAENGPWSVEAYTHPQSLWIDSKHLR